MSVSPLLSNPPAYAPPRTLADALEIASAHWSGRPGHVVMMSRARRCVDLLGAALEIEDLGLAHADRLSHGLIAGGLAPRAVHDYAATFCTMLRLCGFNTKGWPILTKPRPAPPRRIPIEDYYRVADWLVERAWTETSDLVWLIAGTGVRCTVEALPEGLLLFNPGESGGVLRVAGRYARHVTVVDGRARAVLSTPQRLGAIRARSYSSHVKRLHKSFRELGMAPLGATFVAIRQAYGLDVLERSGGNRDLVRAMLG